MTCARDLIICSASQGSGFLFFLIVFFMYSCEKREIYPHSSSSPSIITLSSPSTEERQNSHEKTAFRGFASPSLSPVQSEVEVNIAKALKRVEGLRGLGAKAKIRGVSLSRQDLIKKIESHVMRDILPEELMRQEVEMKLWGLLPLESDYLNETLALLQGQVAGFYSPEDKCMYLASDLDSFSSKVTLDHELVHALQDQYWDIAQLVKYKPGHGDISFARAALAEGDATSLMLDAMFKTDKLALNELRLNEDKVIDLIRRSIDNTSPNAPRVLRESLLAPYIYGLLFVNQLRRGDGMESSKGASFKAKGEESFLPQEANFKPVDDAWLKPPETSEQILHFQKWLTYEPAEHVSKLEVGRLPFKARIVSEETEGELGLRLLFSQWMNGVEAEKAASDWGGDLATLLYQENSNAFSGLISVLYDASEDKDEQKIDRTKYAKRAALALFDHLSKQGHLKKKTKHFICIERDARGPLAVFWKDRQLLLMAGPMVRRDGHHFVSGGDCILAEKTLRGQLFP